MLGKHFDNDTSQEAAPNNDAMYEVLLESLERHSADLRDARIHLSQATVVLDNAIRAHDAQVNCVYNLELKVIAIKKKLKADYGV